MTKQDWVTFIHVQGVTSTKKGAEMLLEQIVRQITNELVTNHEVAVPGLGKFKVAFKGATVGRNPQDGSRVEIPPKGRIAFKPSKDMKDVFDSIAVDQTR